MNKKSFALVIVLSLLLSGCSASAGPVPTPPTDPVTVPTTPTTQATDPVTGPTEPTLYGFTDDVVQWGEESLLADIPVPKEGITWFQYTPDPIPCSLRAVSLGLTPQEAKAYVQQLQSAGFNLNSKYAQSIDGRTNELSSVGYLAQNDRDKYVFLRTNLYYGSGKNAFWLTLLFVHTLPSETPPDDALPNSQTWEDDPVRALVAPPPTDYWQQLPLSEEAVPGSLEVHLQYTTLAQVRAYAQQLRDFGFQVNTMETWDSSTAVRYVFWGEDGEGNVLCLRYTSIDDNRAVLRIIPQSLLQEPTWTLFDSKSRYLPQPPQGWTYTRTNSVAQINLPGLDYQGALDYLERIQEFAANMGNECDISIQQQEDGEQLLTCRLAILKKEQSQRTLLCEWYLCYDPQDPQCPCRLQNFRPNQESE